MLFENITHIIFDLDGLLIDSEPLWQLSEEIILQRHGRTWDTHIAKTHIGVRMDECAVIMVRAYQLEIDPLTLEKQVVDELLRLVAERLTILPGADELIREAYHRGLTLAVASSSNESYIRAVVKQCGWEPFISVIASAYNVARGKPAPDVYLQAMDMLQVEPHACIAFEDSINGAKAARAAGIRCVAIPGHGFHPQDFDDIAHFTLPSLVEVMKKLP